MSFFTDLLAASASELPFSMAWKRVRCIGAGHKAHNYDPAARIDKLRSQKHPQNGEGYVYTVNLYRCTNCGLVFVNEGFERTLYELTD